MKKTNNSYKNTEKPVRSLFVQEFLFEEVYFPIPRPNKGSVNIVGYPLKSFADLFRITRVKGLIGKPPEARVLEKVRLSICPREEKIRDKR